MRPEQLHLVRFRSYHDETIDFREHTLVVVSGDTGAGKTSILDGICYALFARTPEMATARDLLTVGADHGEVTLTFTSLETRWRVTRRFGPDAPEPGHLLERLDGDEVVERTTGASAVSDAVAAIIGMSFQSFTSSVLLAQGRFAQFLQASPRDRDAILRELFGIIGLESARTAAAATRDAHAAAADALDDERRQIADVGQARRNTAARSVRIAAATHTTLRLLEPIADRLRDCIDRQHEAEESARTIQAALDELGPDSGRANLVDRHTRLLRSLADARAIRDEAQATLDRAASARDALRERFGGSAIDLAALRTHAERVRDASVALPDARAAYAKRRAQLADRQGELDHLRSRLGVVTTARETRDAMAEALRRVISTREVVHEASQSLAEARSAYEHAASEESRLVDEADLARKALEALQHTHLTDQLRRDLELGRPCPVCGQTVYTVPSVPDESLDDLNARVARLSERAESARETASRARDAMRSAELHDATARTAAADALARLRAVGGGPDDTETTLESLVQEGARLHEEHAALTTRVDELGAAIERESGSVDEAERQLLSDENELRLVSERLGPWATHDDPVGAISTAISHLEEIEDTARHATHTVRAATTDVERADQALRDFERSELSGLQQRLTVLAHRLDTPLPSLELHPQTLTATAADLVSIGDERARAAADAAQAAATAAAHCAEEIAARGAPVGVHTAEDLAPRIRSAAAAERAATDTWMRSEAHVLQANRLRSRARDERRIADVYGQVAIDLQANRFPRFLLTRFHERLAVGATSRLLALSRGAFSFCGVEPDHLAVVDHRRDHRERSAATLSGGERFLASLALALSLSDIASGTDGRLECLFLDEGFSTLDADALELAISGVEQMAGDGRLVVVITHLPGVAERLGSAIRVRQDPSGASHVMSSTPRRERPSLSAS